MPQRKKEDASFGPRLTAIRKARGLTQVDLAKAAGSTQRAISYYENDDGIPRASAVIALAKVLKVSADELLGRKPPKIERAHDTPETWPDSASRSLPLQRGRPRKSYSGWRKPVAVLEIAGRMPW